MQNLTNIGAMKELLARHGFHFSKSLGQNFLVNPSVCPKMAELGGAEPGVGVLEIGAGIGVLTTELADRAEKVVCVEIDKRLFPILEETLKEHDNIKLVHADVMKADLATLLEEEFAGMEVVVCANLPYYITSPILMRLLESRLPVKAITVMVQKEAAQRLCAPMPSREVGAVTAAVRYYAEPSILFPVSRGSFLPSPDVDSCVIRLDVRSQPGADVPDEADFFRVVRAAFSQRRKTLSNCLSAGLGISKAAAGELLAAAGIPAGNRAEQLSLEEFGRLAKALTQQK